MVVVQAFNHLDARGRQISDFEISLVYRVSSRIQGYTEKNIKEGKNIFYF